MDVHDWLKPRASTHNVLECDASDMKTFLLVIQEYPDSHVRVFPSSLDWADPGFAILQRYARWVRCLQRDSTGRISRVAFKTTERAYRSLPHVTVDFIEMTGYEEE